MREALVVLACTLIGSGIGLAAATWLLEAPLQPLLAALLGLCAALLKPPGRYWASALALSAASALSFAGLRVAVTALYLQATGAEAAKALLLLPGRFPQTLSPSADLAPLLAFSLMLTLGQFLLSDGFVRLLSPLWKGVEALRTSLAPALEVRPRDLILGVPFGLLLALLDAQWGLRFIGLVLLAAAQSPLATSTTILVHSLLVMLIAPSVGETLLGSVEVGVQLGVVVATAIAALLMHATGGVSVYRGAAVSAASVLGGLLLQLLAFTALVGPQWAVYVAAVSAAVSASAVFLVLRAEGGFVAPFILPDPLLPSLSALVWFHAAKLLNMDPVLLAVVVNPVLATYAALAAVWGFKLSDGGGHAPIVLLLAASAPVALLLLRGNVKPDTAFTSSYYPWRLPSVLAIPRVEAVVAIAAAAAAVLLGLAVYYLAPPSSWIGYARVVLDLNGLVFAYSFGRSIWSMGGSSLLKLLVPLALGVAALAKALAMKLRLQAQLQGVSRGAFTIYGLAYMMLAASRAFRG